MVTPWVFSVVWNFVKGVFSEKTRDKIKIYNTSNKAEWFSDISSMVPRESIPPEYQLDIYTNDNNNCS
ncbi:unnamed protein product [Orchesella dallaii]|uniref:CRAL-TRIO domain-containing protein n=1 Tax=Orchesella dallaii TaxID=48710 RepID=A0ABP1S6P5_9HEXA